MREKKAKKEHQAVQKTYNEIANDFHRSRKYMISDLNFLKSYLKSDTIIADIGCGNGRLINLLKIENINLKNYIGIDNNQKFIEIASKEHPQCKFLLGDFLQLPLPDESTDLLISIRAFHHITSKKNRLLALQEIQRVLKKNGKAIITVWNLWHIKNWKILLKAFTRFIYTFGEYSIKDTFVPWGKEIKRYYHAFTLKELQKLVQQSGFHVLEQYGISQKEGKKVRPTQSDDLVIIFEKKQLNNSK